MKNKILFEKPKIMKLTEWMSVDGKKWKKFYEALYVGGIMTTWNSEYWQMKLPYILGGYKYWKVEVIREEE